MRGKAKTLDTQFLFFVYFLGLEERCYQGKPEETLPFHPNGMRFEALLPGGQPLDPWLIYSLGGDEISGKSDLPQVYELQSFAGILERREQTGQDLWEFVQECEGEAIWSYLHEVWGGMQEAGF